MINQEFISYVAHAYGHPEREHEVTRGAGCSPDDAQGEAIRNFETKFGRRPGSVSKATVEDLVSEARNFSTFLTSLANELEAGPDEKTAAEVRKILRTVIERLL